MLQDFCYPKPLFEIAGKALNQLPEPLSWCWSISDVVDWIEFGLKLPQYAITFKENKIDGKKLIFINCRTLSSLNVINFDHMKYISKNVRYLYGLPPDNERIGHDGHRGRQSVHDVYGMYYSYLAGLVNTWSRTAKKCTLFDYVQSVGMVIGGRAVSSFNSSNETSVLARLPVTEYLRGGQCAHADRAVAVIYATKRPSNIYHISQ